MSTYGQVEAPLVVGSSAALDWDEVADVVVVGLGGAGVVSALEALEQGSDVIAFDRFGGGGATAYSGGVIYAGNTSIQRGVGIEDSVEDMIRYLELEVGDAVAPETLRRYCEESAPSLDWLMKHGVPYDGTLYSDKTAFPPEGYFLYYSGNEKLNGFVEVAPPVARGHRAVGHGFNCGKVFFDALYSSAIKAGLRFRPHSPVTRLVTNADGHVLGVECNMLPEDVTSEHQAEYAKAQPQKPFNGDTAEGARENAERLERAGVKRLIRARKGVILSSGGFAYDLDLLNDHAPLAAKNFRALFRMGSMGDCGTSVRLGGQVNAAMRGLEDPFVGRYLAPPNSFLKGILVNSKGERFVNEATHVGRVGKAIFRQPEGVSWLILPASAFWRAVRESLFGNWFHVKYFGFPAFLNMLLGKTKRATSIEKIAAKCGIDPQVSRTIAEYNADILASRLDRFGKPKEDCIAFEGNSFYAVNFCVANPYSFTLLFTLGGVVVDEATGSVLDKNGSPVPGLYAAGRAAFGICSNNYISGLSIGDCVFSGRRAGRNVSLVNRAAEELAQ